MSHTPILPARGPQDALGAILATYPRPTLEALTGALIDHLDTLDGDTDREPNGDELDGSLGEDDFCHHNVPVALIGAGCPISDPDLGADDDGEETECEDAFWHSVQRLANVEGAGCPIADPSEPDYRRWGAKKELDWPVVLTSMEWGA